MKKLVLMIAVVFAIGVLSTTADVKVNDINKAETTIVAADDASFEKEEKKAEAKSGDCSTKSSKKSKSCGDKKSASTDSKGCCSKKTSDTSK